MTAPSVTFFTNRHMMRNPHQGNDLSSMEPTAPREPCFRLEGYSLKRAADLGFWRLIRRGVAHTLSACQPAGSWLADQTLAKASNFRSPGDFRSLMPLLPAHSS